MSGNSLRQGTHRSLSFCCKEGLRNFRHFRLIADRRLVNEEELMSGKVLELYECLENANPDCSITAMSDVSNACLVRYCVCIIVRLMTYHSLTLARVFHSLSNMQYLHVCEMIYILTRLLCQMLWDQRTTFVLLLQPKHTSLVQCH